MKKTLLIVVAVVVLLGLITVGSYNGMVTARESIDTGLANIDSQLQRRADLIPNLVASVNSFTAHESDIVSQITEARQKLVGATSVEDKAAANDALTAALNGLTVIVENYPELKSDTTYLSLMDELAGTENRISVARNDYNEIVRGYNSKIIKFPSNLMANLFGFEKAAYFSADGNASEPVVVEFNNN